tara:strand:- start:90 stop:656 length:567 start_codon:yes stop_codon:yes gene_type:complete
LKSPLILFFLFCLFFSTNSISKKFVLDDLTNPGITSQGQRWNFITDGVMGGLSEGKATITSEENTPCYKMIGNVTTKNNGGFIQIRTSLFPYIEAKNFTGIYIRARGNNKNYALHIRSSKSLGYWQYYSYSFFVENKFVEIKIPFNDFQKSNFTQPNKLSRQDIKTIGLVAGFNDFYADICLSEIGFY